ncbi:amidohydrolase [Frankia sp. Cpl3]|nr:amidohydrolase [Frankia sp. Cpl3]
MTYSGQQKIFDADSHLMELPDFLDDFLTADQRATMRRDALAARQALIAVAVAGARTRRDDPVAAAAADERLLEDKGWSALGGFDPAERARALDLLGFRGQLVFATFATSLFRGPDLDRLYIGSAAHNSAMAAFCAADSRLLPVAYVPLADPERALATAAAAIDQGCAAVMVPSTPAGERAPTHPDLDPFWDLLSSADVPFVLHVGGGAIPMIDRAFHNNGRPVTDHLGGGENLRSKDYLAIHHSPAVFLGALILDGLFDRFPGLRGGCMEQGAGWVVSWLRHLDAAQQAFSRTEEPLRALRHRPSDYVRRHLKFTPFPNEPVGWMIEAAGAELFMFSSDYPHPEGTTDPISRFEANLVTASTAERELFYAGNFVELIGRRQAVAAP